jgi:hypothetical protein
MSYLHESRTLVNAALSLGEDYSRLSSHEFEGIASRLANRLANRGVFFFMGWRRFLLVILAMILAFTVLEAYAKLSLKK